MVYFDPDDHLDVMKVHHNAKKVASVQFSSVPKCLDP